MSAGRGGEGPSRGRRLDYRWNLRRLMADQEMYSTTSLVGPLRDRGIELSAAQVYRLVTQTPERLNLKVLVALCDILGCTPNDLIEPVAGEATPKRRATSSGSTSEQSPTSAPEEFKPRRARITDDDQ